MPRQNQADTPTAIPSAALVASATRYPGKAARIYMPNQDWQRECYRHFGICGEARFAANFFGHALSRAVLKTATLKDGNLVPDTNGEAFEALGELFNGTHGQPQMLQAIGMHFVIAGECYLVGRDDPEGDGDLWEIVSPIEMQVKGTGENASWHIDYADGSKIVDLTESDVVIRLWLPNPARKMEADSPFRALLPILSEIEWLTRHVFAQISSRLAGAGILLLPQGMSFPPATDKDGNAIETTNEADAVMAALAEAMMTPLEDPGNVSSVIPTVMTAPDDAIDKVKLLHFWSNLDENSMALRSEAIRRFALGMDLPPEQVLGMSSNNGTGGGTSNGVSHWGAWQIEESTIKMHVEPMLDVVTNALTVSYLRPLLSDEARGFIIYDTSALRLRPDRSKESLELWDRGLLSNATVLRENGFKPDDAPTPDEWQRWMLYKMASGSATPEQVQAAFEALGIPLPVVSLPGGPLPIDPPETPQSPSLLDHPTKPRDPSERVASILPAAEALVFRALERAGNRIRQQAGVKPPGVPAYEMHTLYACNGNAEKFLDDAWSCAAQVFDGVADVDKTVQTLNAYCLSLMSEQSSHTRERLADWLEKSQ